MQIHVFLGFAHAQIRHPGWQPWGARLKKVSFNVGAGSAFSSFTLKRDFSQCCLFVCFTLCDGVRLAHFVLRCHDSLWNPHTAIFPVTMFFFVCFRVNSESDVKARGRVASTRPSLAAMVFKLQVCFSPHLCVGFLFLLTAALATPWHLLIFWGWVWGGVGHVNVLCDLHALRMLRYMGKWGEVGHVNVPCNSHGSRRPT